MKSISDFVHIFNKIYPEDFWFECGDGWYDIIRNMSEKLEPFSVQVAQVKEKFGLLCVYLYVEGDDHDYVQSIVSEAEAKSQRTCEYCGNPGILRVARTWVKTLCDGCDTMKPCLSSLQKADPDGNEP